MSRFEIENDRHILAYGVDNVTSVFVQVLDKTIEDEDNQLVLRIDNLGIVVWENAYEDLVDEESKTAPVVFTDQQNRLIDEIKQRFVYARKRNNHYPNLHADDIVQVAKAFAVDIDARVVYEALD